MKLLKQKKILISLAVVVIFLLARLINQMWFQPTESGLEEITSRKEVVEKKFERNVVKQAQSTLEKPEELLEGQAVENVRDSIQVAIDYLSEFKDLVGIEPTYYNRLSITDDEMLQTLATMVIVGYQWDKDRLMVYGSQSENVHQFVFSMSHPERRTISFVGNYVIGTQQLEIVSMKGNPIGDFKKGLDDLTPNLEKKEQEEK
ncbi:hypothetical protein [Streptococcus merionis]|uniref:hypothetical protein n=1 Tax=Streptococcus merionis TaxID=400065 RepID=UPI003510F603